MNTSVFSTTPSVAVRDARGLAVRELQYHRHPDTPAITDSRLTRHRYDTRGLLSHSTDARLYDLMHADPSVKPNFTCLSALSGDVQRTDSADAGISVTLIDAAGRPALDVNATGTARTWQYEGASLPGRPLSVTEQASGGSVRITERYVYAGTSVAERGLNLAGQCVRHYDTAGRVQLNSLTLTGAVTSQSRQMLADTQEANWQGADEAAWGASLTGAVHVTQSITDAAGTVLTITDAVGNAQRMAYDLAGLLKGSWLTLKDGQEQVIVASVSYSAAGQKLREVHGNGVVNRWTYEPETQRLTDVKTERPNGHAGGAKVLQDLRYEYDAVGNVLQVSNATELPRFWRNQKVVPENTYVYDSLYQLVSVTGREMANAGQTGAGQLPAVAILPVDSSTFTNYTRIYTYDRAGNLTQIRHSSPVAGKSHTTDITVSERSNRAVLSSMAPDPAQVEALFTSGGQQTQLLPGQRLNWNGRGELFQVTPVVRTGQASDRESYRYDSQSQRVSKTTLQQTSGTSRQQRVVYLPGLELRSTAGDGTLKESLQVITVGESGGAQVRVLHWEMGKPDAVSNNQVRYSYGDLIQSTGLEVDEDGYIISREEYYPYGGSAVLKARSQVEANYKTIRYSGKERDATGLYYYGYRYYQSWAGRWLSADPAGTIDGLNLYRMVRNNPISIIDDYGMESRNINRREYILAKVHRFIPERIFSYFSPSGVSLRPTRLHDNGLYKPSNKFKLQEITTENAKKILGDFNAIYESLDLEFSRNIDGISEESIENVRIASHLASNTLPNLARGKKYALVDRNNRPYSVTQLTQNAEEKSIEVNIVISHPYTQFSRANEVERAQVNLITHGKIKEYSVKGVGNVLTTLAIVKEISTADFRTEKIITNAINIRSQNLSKKLGATDDTSTSQPEFNNLRRRGLISNDEATHEAIRRIVGSDGRVYI